ncbi:MAG TPA: 5'-nucleotidase C-terminal domain-containing protein [Gemmatimonadaceae bacterium]
MKSLRLAAIIVAAAACAPSIQSTSSSQASGPFELLVLSTTDTHGRIRSWDYYGDSAESVRGLTRAATIVDSVRAANPGRVLLVDAGDLLQGNPFAYVAMKQFADSANPIIAAMNAMGYDAAAIGNHEYNYGVPYLERAVSQAKFPMLSANTWKPDGTHKFRAWTIVERQGVKIGIVGATTPGVMVWDAENVKGRVNLTDIIPAVRTAVGEVKAAGANVVIVTVHSGLNEPASYDTVSTGLPSENVSERIAKEIPGIDLVVYGHSHREQPDLHIGNTLLVQPKNWATSVGVAHLSLSRENRSWRVTSSRGETIQSRGHAENALVTNTVANVHNASVAYANTVIGNTAVAWRGDSARLMDTPLIDLINEVEKKAANADLASSAAFTLDAALAAGPITVARIAQLYPYDNTLRAVRITGKQLRDYLEFSARYYPRVENGRPVPDPEIPGYNFDMITGADYTIDLTRPIGSRVTSLSFKGKPVAPTDSFTLALNNYRQTGGGGYAMLKGAPVVFDQQQEIRQLLIDEVRAKGTLDPNDYFTKNWSLVYPGSSGGTTSSSTIPQGPTLRVITTNDFHGRLEPTADANGVLHGGAAYAAKAIQNAREECSGCEVILLDGGDLFQGTLVSNLSYGRPIVAYYNKMGFTAGALGNHEFDWGVDTLRARLRGLRFPLMAANVRFKDGRDVPWIRDDTIVVRGKTKVGIIGIATPETATAARPTIVAPFSFLDPAPVIDDRARKLRARGANVIIVVAHEGGFCNASDNTSECTGDIFSKVLPRITEKVDLFVAAHTHGRVNTRVKDIPVIQARWAGQAIGIADIPLGTSGGASGPARTEVRSVNTAELEPFAPVDSIVKRSLAEAAPLINRRITTLRTALNRQGNQYPLANLVADSHRWAAKADFAVMNNRGVRTGLAAGEITYGKLFEIEPFANTIVNVKMTGAEFRAYLEKLVGGESIGVHVSGLKLVYDPAKPAGSRIVSLTLDDGRTLSDTATYTVAMNNFIAEGGSNLGPPTSAPQTPTGIVDIDALVDYIKTLPSPLVAPPDARIVAVLKGG